MQRISRIATYLPLLLLSALTARADVKKPVFEEQKIGDISIGYGVAVGDVDGDKKPDVLLADKSQFAWYRNPGKRGAEWKRFVMVDRLTKRDNVCIAARDINGDGKVEVAVGAMWNPGNTVNTEESGSVHYLVRPDDPTKSWKPIQLHHEPTTHRMRWLEGSDGHRLVVLPLHGRGNRGGKGAGVKIFAYSMPKTDGGKWTTTLIDESLHKTHNFDVLPQAGALDRLLIAGAEGVIAGDGDAKKMDRLVLPGMNAGAGEVRYGSLAKGSTDLVVTIEPMHGTHLVAYKKAGDAWKRTVLDDVYADGHAIACGDLLGMGRDQVVAGWRNPNKARQVGVKLYAPLDASGSKWKAFEIDVKALRDRSGMACEDLRIADLDGDGKLDIVAAGRATRNLKIYWSKN